MKPDSETGGAALQLNLRQVRPTSSPRLRSRSNVHDPQRSETLGSGTMPAHAPPSPNLQPSKRVRHSSADKDSPTSLPSIGGDASPPSQDGVHGSGAGKVGQSSNFRNVSACNRCRLRKNRCDQKLPSCASCEKANVACVGYDPITKREIPRRYTFPMPLPPGVFPTCFSDSGLRGK